MDNKIKDVVEVLKQEIHDSNLKGIENYVCNDAVVDKYLNNFELPHTWAKFLESLLCNKQILNNQKLIRAKSLFMDICYIMIGVKTPKSISLAQTVHHLFRSKHLINILCKLGHCVSYFELSDCNSFIIKKQLSDQDGNNTIIPSNIISNNPTLFLHGAIDNNDFSEETICGKTTHVTSTILYQEYRPDLLNNIDISTKASVINVQTDSLNCPPLESFNLTNSKPIFNKTYIDINN